jgi:tetratricopeptide (TPR) repeat protein
MNDIYKALDDCTESIRLVPDNPRAYLTRGNAYLRRGAYGRAIADLEEARRLDTSHHLPTQEPLAKAYFRRSDQLQSQDQPGEAASMLSRAVELDPAYSPASHETANHPAPTAEITPTPRTPSADASPQLRAKPILTEDLAQPAEVAVRVRQAEQQLAAGRIAAAINEYSAAVALDRERADLYVARGNLWLRLQFADTALLDAQEAIRLAGDAPAYRLEAEAFLAQGNHYRAISSASEAMRQGPIDLSTIALRGRAYLGREMYDEAIRDLTYASEGDEKLAVQIRPLLAEAHFLRGRALEKQGDPTAAAADLQLAEKLGWSAEEER